MTKFWITYFILGLGYFFYSDISFRNDGIEFLDDKWTPTRWYTQMLLFIVLTWPAWVVMDFKEGGS